MTDSYFAFGLWMMGSRGRGTEIIQSSTSGSRRHHREDAQPSASDDVSVTQSQ
jgi:hypothetical protein